MEPRFNIHLCASFPSSRLVVITPVMVMAFMYDPGGMAR